MRAAPCWDPRTFDISIVPDEDCCALFTPRHPETHARLGDIEAVEATLPIGDLIETTLGASTVERLTYPVITSAVAG